MSDVAILPEHRDRQAPHPSLTICVGAMPWFAAWCGSYLLHSAVASFLLYHSLCFSAALIYRARFGPRSSKPFPRHHWLALAGGCLAGCFAISDNRIRRRTDRSSPRINGAAPPAYTSGQRVLCSPLCLLRHCQSDRRGVLLEGDYLLRPAQKTSSHSCLFEHRRCTVWIVALAHCPAVLFSAHGTRDYGWNRFRRRDLLPVL